MKDLNINFAALSNSLEKQLEKQGLSLSDGELILYQKLCNEISNLLIRDILTSNEARKARQKLIKQIAKNVTQLNNEDSK